MICRIGLSSSQPPRNMNQLQKNAYPYTNAHTDTSCDVTRVYICERYRRSNRRHCQHSLFLSLFSCFIQNSNCILAHEGSIYIHYIDRILQNIKKEIEKERKRCIYSLLVFRFESECHTSLKNFRRISALMAD